MAEDVFFAESVETPMPEQCYRLGFFTSAPARARHHRMSEITLYHNPKCSTSRKVLEMLRERGHEPRIIEYLKTPPDRATLQAIVAATGEPVRALVREKAEPYQTLGLADRKWTDDELIDFMLQEPVLINRPILVTDRGARLCRPVERMDEVLPR
ncbi:arsenate reductase (glutaredoxin) [Verticiella sediminum]